MNISINQDQVKKLGCVWM